MRLYLYLAAAVVLIGAVWYEIGVHKKAARMEAAESALTSYRASVEARDKEAAKERAEAQGRSERLALTLDTVNKELEALRANPIKSVVFRDRPAVDGKCSDPRLSPDWFRVRFEAYAATNRALHPAN